MPSINVANNISHRNNMKLSLSKRNKLQTPFIKYHIREIFYAIHLTRSRGSVHCKINLCLPAYE